MRKAKARSRRALKTLRKILHFIFSAMGNHWRVLNWGVYISRSLSCCIETDVGEQECRQGAVLKVF